MAIVYSYPTAAPELQDLLVGTEMAVQGGEDAPRTRTFTIGSIIGLAESSAAGVYATIASVDLKADIDSPTITGTLTTVNDAIFNGVRVGKGNNNIFDSTALGFLALNNQTLGTYGNTAVGYTSLHVNSTGFFNTAVGTSSMANNTTGANNTAVGLNALSLNISGSANVAVGGLVMTSNTTGNGNVAVGVSSLSSNTTGNDNTTMGRSAMESSLTGKDNTAVGWACLQNNTDGTYNVALGSEALRNGTTGNYNTAIGGKALSIGSWTNATALGYDAQVANSDTMRLGNTFVTAVVSQVGSWSDERDKTEIRDTVLGLDFVNSLRAVDYKWDYREDYKTEMPSKLNENATEEEKAAHKILTGEWVESCKLSNLVHDGTHARNRFHHGLIAQELKEVINASGVDFGGFQDNSLNGGDDLMTVSYIELIAPMIKAIQELKAEIELLKSI